MSQHNGDTRSSDLRPEQLTAYALGQLDGDELVAAKAALGTAGPAARAEVREVQSLAAAISAARNAEALPPASTALRELLEKKLDKLAASELVSLPAERKPWWRLNALEWTVVGGICCLLVALLLFPAVQAARSLAGHEKKELAAIRSIFESVKPQATSPHGDGLRYQNETAAQSLPSPYYAHDDVQYVAPPSNSGPSPDVSGGGKTGASVQRQPYDPYSGVYAGGRSFGSGSIPGNNGQLPYYDARSAADPLAGGGPGTQPQSALPAAEIPPGDMPTVADLTPKPLPRGSGGPSASRPGYGYSGMSASSSSSPGMSGYGGSGYGSSMGGPGRMPQGMSAPASDPKVTLHNGQPESVVRAHGEAVAQAQTRPRQPAESTGGLRYELSKRTAADAPIKWQFQDHVSSDSGAYGASELQRTRELPEGRLFASGPGGEQYEPIVENLFLAPTQHPLSTFSIDVDTASYANVRRFLTGGQLPPPNAVRIEELVNYFSYSYPQPKGADPFSVNMETAECPWQPGHLLLRVGLKGKEIHRAERPPSNLVFLLDVSGSMADQNKLPLLKAALLMLVAELTENDRVSIVTYAGEAGLRLPPTRGNEKPKIMAAIESLSANGSTNGSAGIELAYEQAGAYFLKEGANRVILATDGDLNVGVTSDDALVRLIKDKAAGGTFLTVLGFGTGNLKDAKLEKLADNGNGMYAYIDSVREGRKVLVEQMSGSTVTIAKDVKIQIEFNPAQIASYRLLGYENRILAAKDFNDDKKDAGEIGAGHTVTALYELVPVGAAGDVRQPGTDPLKYQAAGAVGNALRGVPEPGGQRSEIGGQEGLALTEAAKSGELLTLKLRYKQPDGDVSKLLEYPLKERGGQFNAASKDLQFAAAVASFGMILRGSEHRASSNLAAVAEIAGGALGDDTGGYRAEFVDLVRKAQSLGAK